MSRPVSIVASPVIFKNKFLLLKRTKDPYAGMWAMPGGKIELGEQIDEAIIREVFEETGLKVKFVAVRGFVSEILKAKELKQFLMWVCETRAASSNAIGSHEGEVRWFSKEEIDKYKNEIIDYSIIKTFFLGKKKKIKFHESRMKLHKGKYILEFFG